MLFGGRPKRAALTSMLVVGEDDKEEAMGWDDNDDNFKVGDGENKMEDDSAGVAVVLPGGDWEASSRSISVGKAEQLRVRAADRRARR